MSSLSQEDIDTLASIGHDTTQTIVCLVVEAILYSKANLHIFVQCCAHPPEAIFFVLVIIAGRLLL